MTKKQKAFYDYLQALENEYNLQKENEELKAKLTEATEILKKYHDECPKNYSFEDIDDMAEKFLKELENDCI